MARPRQTEKEEPPRQPMAVQESEKVAPVMEPGTSRVKVRAGDGGMGVPVAGKIVYLTIKDGCTDVTPEVLAVLQAHNLIAE